MDDQTAAATGPADPLPLGHHGQADSEPGPDVPELGLVPTPVLGFYSYLCARLAVRAGVLEEVARPGLEDRLVCLDRRSGRVFAVPRPTDWSPMDEERHLDQLRVMILSALKD